jgi:GxxExxY protein
MEATIAPTDLRHRALTWEIIGSAIEVHRVLGSGMLESAYSSCLAHEFSSRKLPFARERPIGLQYKDLVIDHAFRADFIVADSVLVEVKAVDALAPIHVAQVLTYLRLTKLHVGLILNFHVEHLRSGVKRVVL